MEEERIKHESFAQILFTRTTGKSHFYGSELEQDHYITMTVKESEVSRDLSREHHFADRMVLKLRLSNGQFSELITSMNRGDGVPCTLEFANGKKIEEYPQIESRKEFVHRKFKERMKMFADQIRERRDKANEIVKKKTLTKDNVHELSLHLAWLTQEIESNIPFFAECFQETVDNVVHEAKLEVENAIQHKISVLGLSALHEQNKLLEK